MFPSKQTIRVAIVALSMLLTLGFGVSTASAQQEDLGPYGEVSNQNQGTVGEGSEVLGRTATRSAPSASLPLTGGEIVTIALVGGGLLVLGGAAITMSRRRTSHA